MRLGDPQLSRAVLIGASAYQALPDLPAVKQNIADLQRLLTDPSVWGLPESHCVALVDVESVEVVLDALHTAAQSATDTLLVYYAGHGLLDQSMNLRLALPASDSKRLYKSLQYEDIRQELRDATQCPAKVVILDCCFSGRAMNGRMGRSADIADQAAVEGTWLVTASAEHAPALSPPGEPHTAFTGELIRLLDHGIAGGPPLLDVDTLYLTMHRELRAKRRPEPQQRIDHHGAQIVFARNRWHARGGRRAEIRASGGGPEETSAIAGGTRSAALDRLREIPRSLADLTSLIDDLRAAGKTDEASSLLQAVGRHRDAQVVAATLARCDQEGRSDDVGAILDGLAMRSARHSVEVLDVLSQVDAQAASRAVLERESDATADRLAEIVDLLTASPTLNGLVEALFDTTLASAADDPGRVVDILGALLLRKVPTAAERLADLCRTRASDADIAVIADALRESGRDAAAFRLYPSALDVLAGRHPDQVAMLAAGLRRHGDERSSMELAVKAAEVRRTGADRADLLVSFRSVDGLNEEIAWITDTFAGEPEGSALEDLADALRQRGGDTVALYLSALGRQPIAVVLRQVNELVTNGRVLDAFAILEQAGATRPADELDLLTAGLEDTPEFSRQQRTFAAVLARRDCAVDLYRLLHRRKDGRFRLFRAQLIKQPPPIFFDILVELILAADADLGGDLLRSAADESDYVVADELVRYADHDTAEILILAAAGLPDLKRIVHALRRRGFHLQYQTEYAAKLLLRQSDRVIVVVVSALVTADAGPPAVRAARRFAALPTRWVAYLLYALTQRTTRSVLSGPESEAISARGILAMTADYPPDRATKFAYWLRYYRMEEAIDDFVGVWIPKHHTGVDAFIFAAVLDEQFGRHLSERVLQNRAYLPQEFWRNSITTAVSEVLHHARTVSKSLHRFPVPASVTQRLVTRGAVSAADCCLLVIEFRALWSGEVVFTESFVRYGTENPWSYAKLAQADHVARYDRRLWLTRNGVGFVAPWSLRADEDAQALSEIIERVRVRVHEVRARYLQLGMKIKQGEIEA
ncbi:caspase family protein [Actinoplanes sp. GCM10030250]|uniref:caspase, EACC1-associated type n=1 Tax=Actinoplanes sp. GCM10030250 TaxID=3273376 RepID=UPI00361D9F7C